MNPYRRRGPDYSIWRPLTAWAVCLFLFVVATFVFGKLQ